MALDEGPTIAAARESYKTAFYSYEAFSSMTYPQLRLQGQAPGYFRSISSVIQPDGTIVFVPQSQANSSLSLSLTQQLPFTGGEISISSGLNRIDLLESQTKFYRSTPLSVTYRQPIFQLNRFHWDSRAQELRLSIAEKQWQEAVEDIAIEVTNRFFETYLAVMSQRNARNNVMINDTLYNISVGRYNVGKIAENDLLQGELALLNAKTQLSSADIAAARAMRTLAFLIGASKETVLELIPPPSVPLLNLDPTAAVAQARNNRSDFAEMSLQTLSAERSLTEARLTNSFSATLSANAGLNQRSETIPLSYQNLLDQQQLSISFEIPLVQWGGGSAAVQSALSEQGRVETAGAIRANSVEEEVMHLVMSLRQLEKQVGISAKADTIAQRRFDVAKDRYLIGKIDVTNLFLAQNEKNAAHRTRIQTLWDYWAAYYRLRRLTLYDFERNERVRTLEPF
ncbi:MAG: TolC family protein [Ignavibacteriales bacterium]|nr:TolC family protein [Ignavibacteriales bacterium]